MAFKLTTRPMSFGMITVTNHGTSVSLLVNLPAGSGGNANHQDNPIIRNLTLSAPEANDEVVYVGWIIAPATALDRTTLMGVIARLEPGQTREIEFPVGGQPYDASLLYVDADVDGDQVHVVVDPT